ncbi:MAG: hypothetical protein GY778_14830 [bacterium]|nr:hypothetical protein [bacterium]
MMSRHHQAIDRFICDLLKPGSTQRRGMIFAPPRHGKSELTSVWTPAWHLGSYPRRKVILSSYGQTLPESFSERARTILEDYGPRLFGVGVSKTSRAKGSWQTTHGGGIWTAGITSGTSGRGANLLVIDDPIKDSEQALSPTYRQKARDWFDSVAQTRLEPGAAIILMHTRWHAEDLAGWLLQTQPEKWRVLSLPAIAREGDVLGRQPGEALWPERWPLSALLEKKANSTPYWWEAMYQQTPGQYGEAAWPDAWFSDIWCHDWPKAFELSAVAIDPALGHDKVRGDYTATVFAGLHKGIYYVDCHMAREATPYTVARGVGWYRIRAADAFACEVNGFQELLAPMFHDEARRVGEKDFHVIPLENYTN